MDDAKPYAYHLFPNIILHRIQLDNMLCYPYQPVSKTRVYLKPSIHEGLSIFKNIRIVAIAWDQGATLRSKALGQANPSYYPPNPFPFLYLDPFHQLRCFCFRTIWQLNLEWPNLRESLPNKRNPFSKPDIQYKLGLEMSS